MSFFFGDGVVSPRGVCSSRAPVTIPLEMAIEYSTPVVVIPMRSAISVAGAPCRCMPKTMPLVCGVSFPPRFTQGYIGTRTRFGGILRFFDLFLIVIFPYVRVLLAS
jgi:hypothetical protein